jgi:hypothetical protein
VIARPLLSLSLSLLLPACAGPRAELGTVQIPPAAPLPAAETPPEVPAPRPPRPAPAPEAPPPDTPTKAAAAKDALRHGQLAMACVAYAEACAHFAESLRLQRALGTLLELGECEHLTGHDADACQHFRAAAQEAQATGQPARAQIAQSRLASLGCPP